MPNNNSIYSKCEKRIFKIRKTSGKSNEAVGTTEKETKHVYVFNTFTKKIEWIAVSKVVYDAFRRSEWNIKKRNKSFFQHEIQFTCMAGNSDLDIENLDALAAPDSDPADLLVKKDFVEQIRSAVKSLSPAEEELIQALFYEGVTETKYGKRIGLSQARISQMKHDVLKKLKKFLKKYL